MHAIIAQSASRLLAVLLGGSGQTRNLPGSPTVPALLKPYPSQPGRSGRVAVSHRVGGA